MLKIRISLIALLLLSACGTPLKTPDAHTTDSRIGGIGTNPTQNENQKIDPKYSKRGLKHSEFLRQNSNIWPLITSEFKLDRHTDKKSVKEKINYYAKHPEYLNRVVNRATPFLYHIVEEIKKRDMPMEIALLPVVESAYQPFAYSPSHASGLWQFISSTGKIYGLKQNWWYDGRRDPIAATSAALDYLENLHNRFNDWTHALASYNTGENKVAREIKKNKRAGKPTDFFSLKLYKETRGYVPSLLAISEIFANPEKYNLKLKAVPNQPYFETVDTKGQIDMAIVAESTGLSMEEIYNLNAGFNRWATPPDGPHRIILPINKADTFRQKLASLSASERITWQEHIIKKGETIDKIAQRYGSSITAIKDVNRIQSNVIRTGNTLLIPKSQKPLKEYSLTQTQRYGKPSGSNKTVHKVKRGDSLWNISRTYGVTVDKLCKWNGLNKRSILKPGQKLVLWLKGKPSSSGASQTTYRVKQGDNLWDISRRFNVTVANLRKWNGLNKRSLLKPGQKLIIN